MEKKYQFFIYSTYEDLKSEREKAIYTILEMEQFPVGMELFSVADEDQWDVISQTIDTSDYYVLIIGRRYGSIIPEGNLDAGISYTEKEFNYALSKCIPVLAFIMDEEALNSIPSGETPDKAAKHYAFKNKVKNGRYIKFFKNSDQLATYLSQSIHKAIRRGDRPGWVRATDFNIEESHARILQLTERIHTLEVLNAYLKIENTRRPELHIVYCCDPECENEDGTLISNEPKIKDGVVYYTVKPIYLNDVKDGISYRDEWGRKVKAAYNDVWILRYFFQNGFSLVYNIVNGGTASATRVRVHINVPNGLLVVSNQEIWEYMQKPAVNGSEEAHKGRMRTWFGPDEETAEGLDDVEQPESHFITIDELLVNEDIADLLKPGEYEIKCTIICNELSDAVKQTIKIIVE